jgi:hypothetical protein
MVAAFVAVSMAVSAASLPPSTWVALTPLPGAGHVPVFALAVNPTNDEVLIAGNGQGGLYRSVDGGTKWTAVHTGKSGILTISYSSFNPSMLLAGTRNAGALVSVDGGTHWAAATGLDGRAVRAFGFARSLVVAGTDHGIYSSVDGLAWTPSGLASTSIDAVAVTDVNPPVRIVVGGDGTTSAGSVPLYLSLDGGATWVPMKAAVSGTIVTRLAAGPLPLNGKVRPLVLGTNSGLFISADNGANFKALSGGLLLQSTDYTQVAFTATHFDRFYAASDGGGGGSGGLWSTADSGQHFSSLQPPLLSVTALAASGDELPILYVATFRPADHAPLLWAYHDTGGAPQGPAADFSPPASAARTDSASSTGFDLGRLIFSSEAPYIALGIAAVAVIVIAVVSHFRGRRG